MSDCNLPGGTSNSRILIAAKIIATSYKTVADPMWIMGTTSGEKAFFLTWGLDPTEFVCVIKTLVESIGDFVVAIIIWMHNVSVSVLGLRRVDRRMNFQDALLVGTSRFCSSGLDLSRHCGIELNYLLVDRGEWRADAVQAH